jgi:glycosyltransferase involved in cell wall biosynthesis
MGVRIRGERVSELTAPSQKPGKNPAGVILTSVIVPVHNGAATIDRCIESILAIDAGPDEVLLCDDASDDDTPARIQQWMSRDDRIRSLRLPVKSGPAEARNLGIDHARGTYLFFTDADTVVSNEWIRHGLQALAAPGVIGVEGATFGWANSAWDRVAPNPFYPRPTGLEHWNWPGQDYGAANIAYRADLLRRLGGFRAARYRNGREDTDLAMRIKEHGSIAFRQEMRVRIQPSCWTCRTLLASAHRYRQDVRFLEDHAAFPFMWGPVMHPRLLLYLLVPPAMLASIRILGLRDLPFLVLFYAYLVALRLVIWREAFVERRFLF